MKIIPPQKNVLILLKISVLLQTLLEILREFYCCTLLWQLCWHSHLLCSGSDFPAMQEPCEVCILYDVCLFMQSIISC